MLSKAQIASLMAITTSYLLQVTTGLGINCRGSGLCTLASLENKANERIMQVLRDAVYQTDKDPNTVYKSGDHVICVSSSQSVTVDPNANAGVQVPEGPSLGQALSFSLSGRINTGGICLFPQLPDSTPGLTLAEIRPLTDALLDHGCGTCGSIPIHLGNNDPSPGILTFNYVGNPSCTGDCIGGDGNASDPNQGKPAGAKFRY